MNTVSESKSILADDNRAASLIADPETTKLLTRTSVTDPPPVGSSPDQLPAPLAASLHLLLLSLPMTSQHSPQLHL